MKNKLLSLILFLGTYAAYSQVGIGTPMPNASAQLEVVASDKGVLIPRITLTGSTDATTITSGNVNSLLVFNTASVSDVLPGYYYWYDNKWNRIVVSNEITSTPGTVIFNPVNQEFTYVDGSGTTQVIDINSIVKASETLTTLVNNGAGSYTYTNEAGTPVNIDVVGDVITNASTILNNPSFKTELTNVIKTEETLTTLVNNGSGSYTYTNEAGTPVNIDVVGDVTTNFSTIVNDPGVTTIIQEIVEKTAGNVTFDSTTNQFSYTDASGNPQIVDISTIVKANETVTTLVNNGAGSYTYTNEAGTPVNIDVVGDVTTNFSTIVNDPGVTTIIQEIVEKTAGNVTFDSTTNQFSYTDASGNPQLVDISTIVKANETITTLDKDAANNGKYLYTSENATATTIDVVGDVITNASTILNDPAFLTELTTVIKTEETLTTLVNNGAGSYTYTNEAGTPVNIDVVGDVTTNFSTIVNDPGVTTIIQEIVEKTAGNVTFDSTTNQFSYTDASGNPQLVDISTIVKANETVTTLVNNGAGSYTYTNEAGTPVNIDVVGDVTTNFSTIVNDPGVTTIIQEIVEKTAGNVTFDSTTNQFSYTDASGNPQLVDISTIVKANETITTLDKDAANNGKYLYTSENATATTIDVVGDVITNATTILNDPSFKTELTNVIKTEETLTTLVNNGSGSYTYTNEAGTPVNIDVVGDVTTNFSTIVNDPGVTTIIQEIVEKTAGNVTFDSTTNQFSYTDASGNPQLVDISTIVKANETITTLDKDAANNGKYLYTSENATATTIDVVGDVITNATTILNDPAFLTELTTVITAAETVTTQSQDLTTGAITYTNEAGTAVTSQVVSTDAGNIVTVGTDGGALLTPTTLTAATTVSNASLDNTSTVTVNGVTSTGAPIINTNETSLTGASLVTTVNGIASAGLDLTPAITAAETVTTQSQDLTTGAITYTNEAGTAVTSQVVSTDAGNIVAVGADGGAFVSPAIIAANETVTTQSQDLTTGAITYTNEAGTAVTSQVVSTDAGNIVAVGADGGAFVSPAIIAANETVTTQSQDLTTGAITYTNEAGTAVTSQVVSTDAGNIVTVGTDGGALLTPTTLTAATTVSNASLDNTSTVTVNGVTSTGAPIINTNETSLTGASLVTTVNGIASAGLDLTPAITAAETVTTQSQDLTTGAITYTNEAGTAVTSQVVSTDAGNIVTVGTDGGALLTPTTLTAATTVSNASLDNTSTVTVNGVTSTGAPIINTNETSLTGASLVTTVNGIASAGLDLTPAITAAETVTTQSQDLTTGAITYTNEAGTAVTSQVVSTDAGNIVAVGADGGAFVSPAIIAANETVTTQSQDLTTGAITYTNEAGTAVTSQVVSTDAGNIVAVGADGGAFVSPAIIAANETVTTQSQDLTTGAITYTNEAGTAVTSQVVSTDAGNIVTVGTDGGALLTPTTLTAATTVSNASLDNTSTVTVNGVTSTGAPIINTNETSLTGASLVTTVNGIASAGLDLTPAITAAETVTTQSQDLTTGAITYTNEAGTAVTSQVVSTDAGNIVAVGADGGAFVSPAIIAANETVTTQSQDLTTGAITYTNEAGTAVTSQVVSTDAGNIVAVGADGGAFVSPAIIAANETVTTQSQDLTTGAITYTNEAGTAVTSQVVSTDAGNIVTVGTDGGALLTPTTLTAATTVSNASLDNTSTVTVNGVTSTGAPIINTNETSLTGASLVTTVNGIASAGLDLTPAITAAETLTTQSQDLTTGAITYTNEAGTAVTSQVVSTDAGNIVAVGADGGAFVSPAIIAANETLTTQSQDLTTGAITYTNEAGTAVTSQVVSTDAGNIVTVGTDGGALLTPTTLTAATTVSNASLDNTSTVTVNGVTSTGAPIINTNETSLTGASLVTTVNGIASAGLDLTPAITAAETVTTQSQDLTTGAITYTNEAGTAVTSQVVSTDAGNIVTVGTDGGALLTPTTLTAATTVSNASLDNTSTVTVNGVTSTGAPIINTNETSLTGASLVTTVNGIASAGLDLTPAITAAETVTTQSQDLTTGAITYTNEAGTAVTSQVVSTDAGNIVAVGADGGAFVSPAIIAANETVTVVTPVVTTGNTIATYTNEAGGTPVDIKETVTSLTDVVTQITDPLGQIVDLHTLTYTDEANVANPIDMSVLVKGVETLTSLSYDGAAHSLVYNDEDGNATEFNMVDLIGDSETLTTLAVNATTATLDYTDEDKVVTKLDLGAAVKEPWYSTTTNVGATLNTENIYMNGWVGIGFTAPSAALNEKLRVNGAITTVNSYYADYVFEDYFKGFSKIKSDYKFKSLPEVENFIKINKHLPGITPINELEKTKEGYSFNVSELTIQLLEKTEEIYLHIIEQNKEIESKDKQIKELKEASIQMDLRLERLEKIIAAQNK